jgi:hypothetical protein
VNAVKSTGEDEIVIARELCQAGIISAVVDETTGFVDDEESIDHHI